MAREAQKRIWSAYQELLFNETLTEQKRVRLESLLRQAGRKPPTREEVQQARSDRAKSPQRQRYDPARSVAASACGLHYRRVHLGRTGADTWEIGSHVHGAKRHQSLNRGAPLDDSRMHGDGMTGAVPKEGSEAQ